MARASQTTDKKSRAWHLYLLLGLLATGGYFFLSSIAAQNILTSLVGLSAVVIVVAGIRMHRPSRPLPWYLFALGLLMFAAGDMIWGYYEIVLRIESPFPSVADVFYLAGYPFIIAGLLLIQRLELGRSRANLIDPIIIATGVGLLSWVFLIGPSAENKAVPLLERLVSIAYPLMDILLLAAVVRLLFLLGRRSPAYYLLAASLVLMLVADTGFTALKLEDAYKTGNPIDAGFLLFYVAFGTAALHPSMGTLSEPVPRSELRLTPRRLALLAAASLMVPGVLVIQAVRDEPIDVPVIVGGVVLILLVLARMAGMMRARERAADRERILRESGSALVSAIDRQDVYKAALDAILDLVENASKTRASFLVGPLEDMAVVATVGTYLVEAEGARLDARDLPDPLRSGLLERRTVEIKDPDTKNLEGALGFDAEDGDNVLVSPLVVQGEIRGALVVATTSNLPEELGNGIKVLSAQVALALESVALAEDVHRRRSEKRFRSLIQNSSDMITVLDFDGTVHYESPAIEQVLGHDPEELVGQNAFDYIHQDDIEAVAGALIEASNEYGASRRVEFRFRHKNGSWRWLEGIGTDLRHDPSVMGVVVNSRDITERKALEEQLQHQAFHDPLTDLPNRALFIDRLEQACARIERSEEPVGVLYMDLDDFKVVNDSLGHEAGDRLLVGVAGRLRACLRPGDSIARRGGDEFTILLEGIRGERDAIQVAERILEALRAPFTLGEHEVFISTSIGIALGTCREDQPENLLRNADMAMYRAKNSGKDHYAVFDPDMHDRALERLRMERDLRLAIEREEFVIYYQPEVKLSTGKISEMEALVRWEHPERGLLAPSHFIPVAEQIGLIVSIGRWALKEACRQMQEWRNRYPSVPPLVAHVNLSAREFRQPELVEEVARVLGETGLDPAGLELEITESVVMDDAPSTVALLQRLKDLGVKLSIDDFGTGYSSLSYLKRFPVDTIKIDRSFVEGLTEDPENEVLVSGIIELAHALGLEVIAEGVETAGQLEKLREMGCDLAQGYYFSEPLSQEAASVLLLRNCSAGG